MINNVLLLKWTFSRQANDKKKKQEANDLKRSEEVTLNPSSPHYLCQKITSFSFHVSPKNLFSSQKKPSLDWFFFIQKDHKQKEKCRHKSKGKMLILVKFFNLPID